MLKLKKIAVTGGLAAGKTTVCQFFKEFGAYVISADEIVHQLLSPGNDPRNNVVQRVISLLGPDIVSGRELDRKKIAAIVFSQPDLLHALEEIVHPAVFDEIEQKYQQIVREKKYSSFVAEIPLLYEAEAEGRFDLVFTVVANPELCKNRFMQQTHQSAQEFEKRMTRQIEPMLKADKAHYTIVNNGDFEQLRSKAKNIYVQLTKE
jgi:dephospho-CoA kinase